MRKLALFAGGILLLAAGGFLLLKRADGSSPIPNAIRQQAAFTIFYPAPTAASITPEQSTIAYNTSSSGLSYSVLVAHKKVAVSEQATPAIFNETGVYSFKLNQAHDYNSFTARLGEISLTKPDGLQGQTVAWANTNGTLILARALQELTVNDWQTFFNSLHTTN